MLNDITIQQRNFQQNLTLKLLKHPITFIQSNITEREEICFFYRTKKKCKKERTIVYNKK